MQVSLRSTIRPCANMQSDMTRTIPRSKLGTSWVSDMDKPTYHIISSAGWMNVRPSLDPPLASPCTSLAPD